MMNIQLQQFLPAQISDEAAFQLVQVVKGLAIALEANYFEQMLHHTGISEGSNPLQRNDEDNYNSF
jgi:hypothetical protein